MTLTVNHRELKLHSTMCELLILSILAGVGSNHMSMRACPTFEEGVRFVRQTMEVGDDIELAIQVGCFSAK